MDTLLSSLTAHEQVLRLGCFAGMLTAMMIWEAVQPFRDRGQTRARRWSINLGLVALDTVAVRVLIPLVPAALAGVAAEQGWGLLNMAEVPLWLSVLIAFFVLDLAIYAQHVVFHKVPVLWRLHRMHHTDLDFDTTTGVRFHPIEILLSIVIKLAIVLVLGAPVEAVILFEVVLNATSLFNHGNIRFSPPVDRAIRMILVTPDMHRVHHSVRREETDSNFGFNFPWWDRIFGTYRAAPKDGQEGMTIGLAEYRDPDALSFPDLLVQPFRDPPALGDQKAGGGKDSPADAA